LRSLLAVDEFTTCCRVSRSNIIPVVVRPVRWIFLLHVQALSTARCGRPHLFLSTFVILTSR
jgi:hypothetical protein